MQSLHPNFLFASSGSRPQGNKGTLLRLNLDLSGGVTVPANPAPGNWKAQVKKCDASGMEVAFTPPPTALVGKYQVFVETVLHGDAESKRRFELKDEEVYVIFNPWCQGGNNNNNNNDKEDYLYSAQSLKKVLGALQNQ